MLHSFVILDIIQFSSLFYDNVTATRCSRLANIDMIKNSGKGTPSWWGWKISCKGIFFFTPPERVTSPIQGLPPSSTERPLVNSVKIFGLINSNVNKTLLVFMLLLCSYNAAKFSFKKTKLSYLAQFPNDLYSSLIYGNYILSYMRTLFYVISVIFSYCLKHYPHKIQVFSPTGVG